MNTNFIKKMAKLIAAGAGAGLCMLAGDRIADDKPAFGLFNKKDEPDDTPDDNKPRMADINEESEHFDSTDVKVEDTNDKEEEG